MQENGSGPNNPKQDEILATVHRSKMEGKPNSRSRSRLYFTLNCSSQTAWLPGHGLAQIACPQIYFLLLHFNFLYPLRITHR